MKLMDGYGNFLRSFRPPNALGAAGVRLVSAACFISTPNLILHL